MEGFALDNDMVLMVGGTWDDDGGRPSSVLRQLALPFIGRPEDFTLFNGGSFDQLLAILELVPRYSTIIWMANVQNDEPKLVNEIKKRNPTAVLVTSKRNDSGRYSFHHLIARALKVHANLFVEIFRPDVSVAMYHARLFDPLGNQWIETSDFKKLGESLKSRITELHSFTRVRSKCMGVPVETPDRPEFFALARQYADVFHSLIHTENQDRFLGNMAFRCERGFPAFRCGDDLVFVSRRNVDKRHIDREHGFVAVDMAVDSVKTDVSEGVFYYGDDKPSVDAPIQVELFKRYENIQYILHAHVYIREAPFTGRVLPCGAIEELGEIAGLVPDRSTTFATINLLGHGSIVMASEVGQLRGLDKLYVARQVPENRGVERNCCGAQEEQRVGVQD